MKVLIDDGNQIRLGTGIGKYTLYLYRSLKNSGIDVSLVDQEEMKFTSRTKQRFAYLKKINSNEYQKSIDGKFDVVLYTNYAVPFRRFRNTKIVGCIPDMVSYLFPEKLPFFYRIYNQLMIKNTVKKADLIFTISQSVKKEILNRFPRVNNRLVYTWLGVYDGIQPLKEYIPYENDKLRNIDDYPFFLFVSTVEKRKNVGMVIDAFIKLKEESLNATKYKLVIVGRPGYGYEEFVDKVNASEFKKDVVFSGYTTDSDCNRLYNHARAFVFPTVYEGFGFAQIECMRCHLPIILSDIPTNREISREYGLFFNLNELSTLVEQMSLIVNDEYDHDKYDALADIYIKDFDWDRIALQYCECLNALVK